MAQPAHGVCRRQLSHPTTQLHQPIGHLGREESRTDAVYRNSPRAQLNRQVPAQVDNTRLTRRVSIRTLLPQRPNPQSRYRRRDQHPAGIHLLDLAPV